MSEVSEENRKLRADRVKSFIPQQVYDTAGLRLSIDKLETIETQQVDATIELENLSIEEKLEKARELIGSTTVIGEVVKPYGPLVSSLADSIRRIYNSYEHAQYNKKISNVLLDRVDCIAAPVKALKRRKDKIENFLNQDYYNSLIRLLAVLKKTQQFITDVSSLWSLRKFPTTKSIKDRFERITKEFDGVIRDLNLEVRSNLELQKKRDTQALHSDIVILNEFLENIGSPITPKKQISPIFEEIMLIKSHINESNSGEIKLTQIPPNELIKTTRPKANDRYGNVIKRCWQTAETEKLVACKVIDTTPTQKFMDQLVLLNKLNSCSSLIRFYGMSSLDWGPIPATVIVYEWAEMGNLKNLYEKFVIDMPATFEISVGICRGLLFLHGCDIMHYDVRCENIMINGALEPKIANFRLCRPIHDDKEFQNISDPPEHWMAPEQFRNEKRSSYYTYKCELFSFGMLLWELAHGRIPYRGWDESKITKHVLAGNREKIKLGPSLNTFRIDFAKIVRAAWQDDPLLRPGLYKIFLDLDKLHKEYPWNKKLKPLEYNDDDEVIAVFPETDSNTEEIEEDDLFDSDIILLSSVRKRLKLSEGIKAHERGDEQKAWECFDYHASINNPQAKYWKGFYLWEGRCVKKDRTLASQLFKEAADQNHPDAQFFYASSLIEEGVLSETSEYLHYMTLAANNNNVDALCQMGEIYLDGKYNIEKDEEKAIQYLKLAALKNEQRALNRLHELGMKLFEY
ncbi:874_t:CDS:2 [Acaulospora morrowiae]|uniref:874_t:CDS:1 n=1 Tax=Acaulospora morrowiae TaxID=94023 RepID=A0A9N9BL45_9GLOM|nr:874_t:CDS:2 [Acaulospora morrowiae]